jgi:hypothetical protein
MGEEIAEKRDENSDWGIDESFMTAFISYYPDNPDALHPARLISQPSTYPCEMCDV